MPRSSKLVTARSSRYNLLKSARTRSSNGRKIASKKRKESLSSGNATVHRDTVTLMRGPTVDELPPDMKAVLDILQAEAVNGRVTFGRMMQLYDIFGLQCFCKGTEKPASLAFRLDEKSGLLMSGFIKCWCQESPDRLLDVSRLKAPIYQPSIPPSRPSCDGPAKTRLQRKSEKPSRPTRTKALPSSTGARVKLESGETIG